MTLARSCGPKKKSALKSKSLGGKWPCSYCAANTHIAYWLWFLNLSKWSILACVSVCAQHTHACVYFRNTHAHVCVRTSVLAAEGLHRRCQLSSLLRLHRAVAKDFKDKAPVIMPVSARLCALYVMSRAKATGQTGTDWVDASGLRC
jgi:hypothetical protein